MRPRREWGSWTPRLVLGAAVLLAAGCAAPRAPLTTPAPAAAVDWARAPRLEVVMEDYAFRPERIALRQGEPVVLRLVNRGQRPHDFTAPAFFAAAATRPGDPVAAAMQAEGGSVDVPAGETRELALVPTGAGSFPLDCVKPLHTMFGMTGEIVVAPPS